MMGFVALPKAEVLRRRLQLHRGRPAAAPREKAVRDSRLQELPGDARLDLGSSASPASWPTPPTNRATPGRKRRVPHRRHRQSDRLPGSAARSSGIVDCKA